VVLPHQHFLGDSSSLCDSLCRTSSSRFYSTANIYELRGIKRPPACLLLLGTVSELAAESFEQLAMPHFDQLCNFACWLAHDRQEAEDLVQEAYVNALNGFCSFQRDTNFRAWIYKILRNTFQTSRLRLKANATLPLDLEGEEEILPAVKGTRERASCCSVRIGSSCSRLWSSCLSPIARCCCCVKSRKCRIRKSLPRLPSR
jgi:hypothetical protein